MKQKRKKKNQRKRQITVISVILILLLIVIIVSATGKTSKQEKTLKQYISYLQEKNYEAMYEMISQESKNNYTKAEFVERNQNIYEGINAKNFEVELKEEKTEKEKTELTYHIAMDTSAGKIEFDNTMTLVKEEKQDKILWTSNDIFPKLAKNDKVKVNTEQGTRGNIYDRNGNLLAGEGTASSVGIVPGKMNNDTKEQDIKTIARLLETTEQNIKQTLSASWVKEDTFVPIKTVEKTNQNLKDQLLQIKGIKITDTKTRIYPYGESTSHLLGYIQTIGEEELEQLADKGYNKNSVIRKNRARKRL